MIRDVLKPLLPLALIAALVAAACGGEDDAEEGGGTADADACTIANGCVVTPEGAVVVLAAGDIASCDSDGDEVTAALLDGLPGTVLTLGDNAYDRGTDREFAECYGPSWGAHAARTRPVPGNHEYDTEGAAGYFEYFGEAAGNPDEGWYSYDLGAWHVIALNSNCVEIGGCDAGSRQEQWLRDDLAANAAACTLAYWHHPRFSSGSENGSNDEMEPIWQALDDGGGDLILAGHEHNYERFGPQTPWGDPDADGIVQIVVGTGGKDQYGFAEPLPNSLVRNEDTLGVLKLTLNRESYLFEFIPEPGGEFMDVGTRECG